MVEKGRAPVRLNTRISADTNDWLEVRAYEMGLTKSAVINLAVEAYRKEVETVKAMPEIAQFAKQFKDME